MKNNNKKINSRSDGETEHEGIWKTGDVFEFVSKPDPQGSSAYLPVDHQDVPPDDRGIFFVEFMELISGKDSSGREMGFSGLISRFFNKRRNLWHFFTEIYWHIVFFINSLLDIIYIFRNEKFFINKNIPQTFDTQDKSRGINIKDASPPALAVPKEISLGAERKEKIQFKTLVLLSSRMFTSGSMRTILTILGISISIGVILFLVSFGYGLQRTVLQRITTEDSLLSLVITLPEDTLITKSKIEDIRKIKEVEKISPLVKYSGNIEISNVQADSAIFMVDGDYFSLAGLMSQDGAPLKIGDGEVIISSAAAALLGFEKEQTVGKKIRLSPALPGNIELGILSDKNIAEISNPEKKLFIINGVIEDDSSAFSYVLNGEFKDINIDGFVEAKVKIRDAKGLDVVKEELINSGYIVSSISDTVEETRKIFRGIQVVLGFFGLIALIISAIGMLNIMTIVLLERTQEIGIMKAIGASNADIWKIVIADAVIIGFLGGIGGTIIGISTSKIFNFAFNILASRIGGRSIDVFQMPPGFMFVIIIFSAVIGFATGIWPAIRASRIAPLEAIKYK